MIGVASGENGAAEGSMRECNWKVSIKAFQHMFCCWGYELWNGSKDQGSFNRYSLSKMTILLCYWFSSKVQRGGTERAECAGTVTFPLEVVTLPRGPCWCICFLAQATVWALLLLLVISLPQAGGFCSSGAYSMLALLRTFLSPFLFCITFQSWEIKPWI